MRLEAILEELQKAKQPNQISIEEILEQKGESWVIAAMIDGSCGYHSARHAQGLIEDYLSGKRTDGCERCYCCFNSDLEAMIAHDVTGFSFIEKHNPEKVTRVIEYAKRTMKLDDIEALTASCMYPTAV